MKIGKVPPPEHIRGSLSYLGTWYGHSIYKDTMSKNTCRYLCRLGNVWYRSPSIRDLLSIPVPFCCPVDITDNLKFLLAAVDETLLSMYDVQQSEQIIEVVQTLLTLRVQLMTLRENETR